MEFLVRLRAIGLLSLLSLTLACSISPFDAPQPQIDVKPDGTFNATQMTPADAEHLLAKQSTHITPVLFPRYLSDGMNNCVASGKVDTFLASCAGGARIFSLQTHIEDLTSYKPKVLRRMAFRADIAAQFMNADPADPAAVKIVLWNEAGKSADVACKCVHYDLHVMGVSEDELWKIANSLQTAKSGAG
jgi:hypothetical protein